jgi:transposase
MVWEGNADAAAFRLFVTDYLVPNLRLDNVVIADNALIHDFDFLVEKCAERGAVAMNLPPFCPFLQPIEAMVSYVIHAKQNILGRP